MNHERKLYGTKYWNLGDYAIGIVAVAQYEDGVLTEWTAYIGATNKTYHEQSAYDAALAQDNRLWKYEAEAMTRGYRELLPMNKYRR